MQRLRLVRCVLALAMFSLLVATHGTCAGDSSFVLTATERNFSRYTPTYLANGFWSARSTLLGTSASPSQMVGLMDYQPEDVSRPLAIPSWNEIDYFDGAEWRNASTVSAATHANYHQALDMHDGLLRTGYRWYDATRATDVSVTSLVSQSVPHLAAVSLELTPHFSGPVRLRFTLRSVPAPQRMPLARMSAEQFSAAAAATDQADLVSGGDRNAIWYPGYVEVTGSGSDTVEDTLWMEGRAARGRSVALAAAIALPPHVAVIQQSAQQSAGLAGLEIEVNLRQNHRYRFTKVVVASSQDWVAQRAMMWRLR